MNGVSERVPASMTCPWCRRTIIKDAPIDPFFCAWCGWNRAETILQQK